MDQILALMLLVGCSGDARTCSEIPVPTPFYSSVAECEADLGLQMRMSTTYDNRVLGGCTAISEDMLEQSGTIEWAVNRGGELFIELRTDEPLLAAIEQDDLQVAAR